MASAPSGKFGSYTLGKNLVDNVLNTCGYTLANTWDKSAQVFPVIHGLLFQK